MDGDRGLGIWFRDGIRDMLRAIDEANLDMVSRFDTPEVRIYRHGFAAAISAVATVFGIKLPILKKAVGLIEGAYSEVKDE